MDIFVGGTLWGRIELRVFLGATGLRLLLLVCFAVLCIAPPYYSARLRRRK